MVSKEKNKTPIYKKWWFWLIIVVIIGGAVAASGNKDAKKVGEGGSSNSSSSQSQDKTEFSVGDIIAFDGKEITVASVQRGWTSEYSKPDAGKEYVRVTVVIENKSDDKASYANYEWKMEDSTGDIKSIAIVLGSDNGLDYGDLASGGKKEGTLVFEVPDGDGGLKLHYSPSFWSNREVIINL